MDMVAAKKENATGGANFYAVRDIAAAVAHEFPGVKIQALAVSHVAHTSPQPDLHGPF
jgi:hypothetical protein